MGAMTTAETGVRTAGSLRGKAILAALALALLAAMALPEAASAHGTGYYGAHGHGQLSCGSYGRITVPGMYAASYPGFVNGHVNNVGDELYYRAHLYRWNGSTWTYASSTGWFFKVLPPPGSSTSLPGPTFTVTRGYWKVSTELHWYDGLDGVMNGDAQGNVLIGRSPNVFVAGSHCAYS